MLLICVPWATDHLDTNLGRVIIVRCTITWNDLESKEWSFYNPYLERPDSIIVCLYSTNYLQTENRLVIDHYRKIRPTSRDPSTPPDVQNRRNTNGANVSEIPTVSHNADETEKHISSFIKGKTSFGFSLTHLKI